MRYDLGGTSLALLVDMLVRFNRFLVSIAVSLPCPAAVALTTTAAFAEPINVARIENDTTDHWDTSTPSYSQEPETKSEPPHRRFGTGTLFGGGIGGTTVFSAEGEAGAAGGFPVVTLPTLETQIFLPHHDFSVDLATSASGTIFGAALGGFYFTQDAYFNFNVGKRIARFIIGPGVGFTAAHADNQTAVSLRLPAEIGIEALTKAQTFGFKLLARPWFELPFGHESKINGAQSFGGGVTFLTGVSGYFVK